MTQVIPKSNNAQGALLKLRKELKSYQNMQIEKKKFSLTLMMKKLFMEIVRLNLR